MARLYPTRLSTDREFTRWRAHTLPGWRPRHRPHRASSRVRLTGRIVRLEPLALDHLDALAEVGLDPTLWRWIGFPVRTREDLRAYIEDALRDREAGRAMPFAIVEASGRPIGSTRYGNVDLFNRRVEIGWTWVAPAWQRTGVNTEAKLLMLEHAFGRLGCNRVEFKTDR